MQLSKQIYAAVDQLSQEGNSFMDNDNFEAAIEKWTQALDLLPPPRSEWEAFMWLSASIGDAYFQMKEYKPALNCFHDALNAPGGIESSFIYYRLGQCQLALGSTESGIESLLRSYMINGEDTFTIEDDGLELLNLLKSRNLIN